MTTKNLLFIVFITAISLNLTVLGAQISDLKDELNILIVSPESGSSRALEIKGLLEKHGFYADAMAWAQAGVDVADGYDLVVVCGQGRRINSKEIVRNYNTPVLGYGPYGCNYFGALDLKNGHPYT